MVSFEEAVRCTIDGSDKVKQGDHENALDGTIEVSQEQHARVIFFPRCKVEITQSYTL
jgi:hypothetical protein